MDRAGGVRRAGIALVSLIALLADLMAGGAAGGAARPVPPPLPCPAAAGWRLERQLELPRRGPGGLAIGGFSAARFDPATGELLLLSDAAAAVLLRWGGIAAARPRLLQVLPLQRPGQEPLDGEALVRLHGQLWVASEGRRTSARPARLLRVEASSGRLLEALALPADWQPGEGRGLASNGGPEALALLPPAQPGGTPALLMAAEQPLLQDPPATVRLLRWQWPTQADPRSSRPLPRAQGALRLPGPGWGLTDLLVVSPDRLLALLRRFEPPFRWRIRLALYPLPQPAGAAQAPLADWDLVASGLTPDNWEGLSPGPPLADGRPSLLLVSDDNFNPLQANRLALFSPIRSAACSSQP